MVGRWVQVIDKRSWGEAMRSWYQKRERPSLHFETVEEFEAYCEARIDEFDAKDASVSRRYLEIQPVDDQGATGD